MVSLPPGIGVVTASPPYRVCGAVTVDYVPFAALPETATDSDYL